MAIDETSYRRGHAHLTLVADMPARRACSSPKAGRRHNRVVGHLPEGEHGGSPEQVR